MMNTGVEREASPCVAGRSNGFFSLPPWAIQPRVSVGPLWRQNCRFTTAFTLVELMIVIATIGLLAAIAIPNFVRARTVSQRHICINNLRQIDGAKQQWAFDFHAALLASPTISDIQPYLGRGIAGSQPACPADSAKSFTTSYLINEIQSIPSCLISPATHLLPEGTASVGLGTGGGGDGGGDGGGGRN